MSDIFAVTQSGTTYLAVSGTDGKARAGANTGWISMFPNTAGTSQFQSVSPDGYSAMLAYTRTSDNSTSGGSQGSYAIGGFAYQDKAGTSTNPHYDAYAGYFEGQRANGTGYLNVVEMGTTNNGSTELCVPYQHVFGATVNLCLSTRGGNNVSAAIHIYGGLHDDAGEPVGAQLDRGIVFRHGSITGGEALSLAEEHRIIFRKASDGISEINATHIGTSPYPFEEVWAKKFAIGGVLKTLSVDASGYVKAA